MGTGQLSALMGATGDNKGPSEWFDLSLLPPFDRVSKYFGFNVSAIHVSRGAIAFRIFTPLPAQLRK